MEELRILFYIVSATIGGALLWAGALHIAAVMESVFNKSNSNY